MKLVSTISKAAVLSLMICAVFWISLSALLEQWVLSSIAFVTMLVVFSFLAAFTATMLGKYALWQVVGVLELVIAWVLIRRPEDLLLEVTVFEMVCFATSSIPFLFARESGLVLRDALTSDADHSPVNRRPSQSRIRHLTTWFSIITAIGLLSASARVLLSRIPAQAVSDASFGLSWAVIIVFAALLPVAMMERMLQRNIALWGARIVILVAVCGCVILLRLLSIDWSAIAMFVGVLVLSAITTGHCLYRRGYRLALGHTPAYHHPL